MTASPETPETNNPEEEVVEAAPKKPVRKRKPAAKKPTAKKPAEKPASPEEVAAQFKKGIDEAKEKFVDATVEPAKEVVNTWAAIADYAADYAVNAKDGVRGWWDGFIGNKKKDE